VIVTLIKYVILFFLLIIKRHLDAKKLISKMENLIIRLARKKKERFNHKDFNYQDF
jgi:hypothetical protein